jgi:hypothetical protein
MSTAPSTFFSGTVGPKGDRPGPDGVFARVGMYLLLAIAFPLALIVYGIWLALFTYARLPWWVPGSTFLAMLLGTAVTGHLGMSLAQFYLLGYQRFFEDITGGDVDIVPAFFTNLPQMILGQVWPGLLVGSVYAGVVIIYKYVRRPKHQERMITPGPVLWARWRKSAQKIAAGVDSPTGGITLGIAQDRRHPWYAGGAAGERFGERIVLTDAELATHALVVGASGGGKALDVDTPIPTPRGFVRMGDLVVGDEVFGSDGAAVRVVRAHDVMVDHPCYEVVFSDGSTIVADAEHLWTVDTVATRANQNRAPRRDVARKVVGTPTEIDAVKAALGACVPGELVSSTMMTALIDRAHAYSFVNNVLRSLPPEGTTKVGPFEQQYGDKTILKTRTVAAWDARMAYSMLLGRLTSTWHDQRSTANVQPLTLTTEELRERISAGAGKFSIPVVPGAVQYPERDGLLLDPYLLGLHLGDGGTREAVFTTADTELIEAWADGGFRYRAIPSGKPYGYYIYQLSPILRKLGVWGDKHIPEQYLIASESQRRALLAGLMDSDGTYEHSARVSFTNKVELLADQMMELAASLGYRPTKTSRHITLPDGRVAGPYFQISFSASDDVFRLERKNVKHRNGRGSYSSAHQAHRYISEIRPVDSRPVRCIGVDAADHLFLAGRTFVATHNTMAMMSGIRDVIRQGRGMVLIDCKGDNAIADQVGDWCRRYGRDFHHWSIFDAQTTPYEGPADAPSFYDPISRGDPSRRKDLIMGAFLWESPYYKNMIENFLQTLFRVQDLVPPLAGADNLSDTAHLLDPEALVHRARHIDAMAHPDLAESLTRASNMGAQERSGISSMWSRINTLTSSTAGQWLRKDPNGDRDIDLVRAAHEGQVVVFTLPGNMYGELSSLVAGLVIQDLKTASLELLNDPAPTPFHVYVDEFSVIDSTNIQDLLARARASRMPCMVATQSLSDLARHDPTFPGRVLDTVSLFLIHRVNSEDDARIFAGLSSLTNKVVERMQIEKSSSILGAVGAATSTGAGYVEDREDYTIPVGAFQKLRELEGILIAKGTDRYVNTYYVIPEDAAIVKLKGGALAAARGSGATLESLRDPAVDFSRTKRRAVVPPERVTYPHPTMVALGHATVDGPTLEATNALDLLVDRPPVSTGPGGPRHGGGPTRPSPNRPAEPAVGAPAGAPLPGVAAGAPLPGVGPAVPAPRPAAAAPPPGDPGSFVPGGPPGMPMHPPAPRRPAGRHNPEEWNGIP